MEQIGNWITTAERLRDIRRARDSFLLRWATDVIHEGHGSSDELSDAREIIETLPVTDRMTRLFGRQDSDD